AKSVEEQERFPTITMGKATDSQETSPMRSIISGFTLTLLLSALAIAQNQPVVTEASKSRAQEVLK
ncbi:MAG: hypothetical protein ACREBD_12005, partial [Blastocatellia bacterium]